VAGATMLGVRREDTLGRRLAELPALAALRESLAAPPSQVMDVVTLSRGEVVLRSQVYDGGIVATLRDAVTEQNIAHRMVGSVARYTFEHLVGDHPGFRRVLDDARRAAACDVPVLISGESGTGKEMLAQAIHNASSRASGAFVGINVTAIPRELLESELFGYEGGTFTGARSGGRAGKFELVGRGTLLLDEIGDMPFEMQAKLLRVLQEKIVQRLGSARDIPVRARIVATTHRDMSEAVELGRFRLDLFHRLRVLELRLPALRERKEDLPLLVQHELRLHAERTGRHVTVAPHVMTALQAYEWPGNVRELVNVLEGELSLLPPGSDRLTRIPPVLLELRSHPKIAAPGTGPEILPLDELERRACEHSLEVFQGNVAQAARALGVAKGTLYNKMKRYGIGPREPLLASSAPGLDAEAPAR
jgi:transcriptional regulator with PAS, ATPase and Fis domain